MNKEIITGTLKIEGLTIPINVLKIKNNFGNIDYTVTPQHGTGQAKKRDGVTLDDDFKHLLDNY